MTEWLLIIVFFAACAVLNNYAFKLDVQRSVRRMAEEEDRRAD